MLILSNNEIISKCSKALKSLGISEGSELENAKNIAWLEAVELPALDSLVSEIRRANKFEDTDDKALRYSKEKSDNDVASAFAIAQNFIDSAIVEHRFCQNYVRHPLIIIAEGSRRCKQHQKLEFNFHCEGKHNRAICRPNELKLQFPVMPASIASNFELKLTEADECFTNCSFEVIARHDKAGNVPYPIEKWRIICEEARKTLIPASTQSRAGAGAPTNDNI